MWVTSYDQSGKIVLPGVINGHPETGSTQKLTNATKDTNTTATVKAGKSYLFTAQITGGFYLGVADVTTDANKLWCCPLGKTILIHIDSKQLGVADDANVTLHYATDTNSAVGYLVELQG